MNQEVLKHVQHQIAQAGSRLAGYANDQNDKPYPKRNVFIRIEKYVKNFLSGRGEQRWVIIPGLRGVGKTTILAQIYLEFSKNPPEGVQILYVSLDEVKNVLNASLLDVIEAYEQILGVSFEKQDKPILLLVDEAQYDPKWASILKSLYDRSKKVCIICSGSSAVSLQTNPDVIRRAIFEKLYPMSFTEFQMIKNTIFSPAGLKQKMKEALYLGENAEHAYEGLKTLETIVLSYWSKIDRMDVQKYLTIGTLPFAIRYPNAAQVYEAILLLLDKIIAQDIEELGKFDSETLGSIKRLLYILADVDVISIHKLTELLPPTRITLSNVFDVLEKAELLIKIDPYGSNTSQARKPSKYLFMTPAIRLSLLNITGQEGTFLTRQGKLLEDIAALHFYREFVMPGIGNISYDSSLESADFILQIANKKQLAVEIGMGDKELRQVISSMKKIKCDYGIIFSSGPLTLIKEENIVKVPLDYFLLM